MTVPHIPILRHGRLYESLERVELKRLGDESPLASVSQANAGLIRRDARGTAEAARALRAMSCAELIGIACRAGELFINAGLPIGADGPAQSPDDYVHSLSGTTGLPHALVRANMKKIHKVLTEMAGVIDGLTRGLDLAVLDRGWGEQAGVPVSFFPTADALGVVLPSNSPGVNSIWIPAVALKVPVVLKPGREEPWTPLRIIQAFIAAGCPPEAFSFYPTDHEGSAAIIDASPRALIFGDQKTVERYAANPAVQAHGPGWSKVLVGEDMIDQWPEFIDTIADSIVVNGGRSCINASAVIVPRKGRELARALAERLARIEPLPVDDDRAQLAGFANPAMAEWIDQSIEEGLATPGAEDLTAAIRGSERRATLGASHYLRPTVVWCDSFRHPLANREFLFPYASVVEMPRAEMAAAIGPSLVVSAITADESFAAELLRAPNIDRLNIGNLPTTHVEWNQPHEGNLFEFLYRRRALQQSPVTIRV
jgi:acyl-CoA reductase-like NAD-dependent aldehyde dehydrogenase